MSFQKYEAYKDSGVEWLGEVPSHWEIRKIAWDIPYTVGWTPPSGKEDYYDGEHPWVTIADMTQMNIEETKSKITDLAVFDKKAQIVPAGSMLFSFKLSVGKVSFLSIDSYTNEAIAAFPPSESLVLSYWKYAAPEFIPKYGRENIYGATLLNQDLIGAVRFFAPDTSEQTQIARFLDHETARIDALIAEQERLIELLKEKRQAVISHAVTKGLDPTAPMKDSGVEWLGEVPEHWDLMQFKFATILMQTGPFGSQLHAEDYIDNGTPLINPAHIVEGQIVPDSSISVDDKTKNRLPRHHLKENDLILARRGELGRCAVVRQQNSGWLCGSGSMRVELSEKLMPDYAYILISSEGVKAELSVTSKGSTMDNLNPEILGMLRLPIPPKAEQEMILERVKIASKQYDRLTSIACRQVELLQERRSALISAAVTGKIDVRGWQPPASVAPSSVVAWG